MSTTKRTIVRPRSAAIPAAACAYFLRAMQSSGDLLNSAGVSAVKNTGFADAAAWLNPGFFTTGAAAGSYATLANAESGVTLAGYSLLVALRIKKSTPVGNEYVMSSYNPGSTTGGIILEARSTGDLRMYANTIDGTTVNVTIPAAKLPLDGNEHTVLFAFPRNAASAEVWMDGLQMATAGASTVAGKSLNGGADLRIGGPQSGNAVAAQIACLQAYQVAKDLGNIPLGLIADLLHRNPDLPLEDWVFA